MGKIIYNAHQNAYKIPVLSINNPHFDRGSINGFNLELQLIVGGNTVGTKYLILP